MADPAIKGRGVGHLAIFAWTTCPRQMELWRPLQPGWSSVLAHLIRPSQASMRTFPLMHQDMELNHVPAPPFPVSGRSGMFNPSSLPARHQSDPEVTTTSFRFPWVPAPLGSSITDGPVPPMYSPVRLPQGLVR